MWIALRRHTSPKRVNIAVSPTSRSPRVIFNPMATYAMGDLQGCLDPLQTLLRQIQFDPAQDHLWFTGDLVNRGPQSLATLRFVRDQGDCAVTVQGNHDLHLLAVAHG